MYKLCSALFVLAACTPTADPPAPTDPSTSDAVGRLAGILDYVAADYPGTVQGGALTEAGIEGEYEEQRVFLKDAAAIAAELPPPPKPIQLAAGITALQQQVARKVEGAEVTNAARALRKDLLAAYDVVLAPTVTPSLATGEEQYHACVQCHGPRGAGDGPLAAGLEPPPRNFLSPEVMADLSPVRGFNAITEGLPGTKMEAYPTLSPSQRWSLAFYIFTFRHDAAAAARGKAAFARTKNALRPTASDLANRNDGDIVATLTAAGLSAAEAGDALAYLRRVAPFETTGAPLDEARRLLAAAVSAYHQGRQSDARRNAAAAYLDGFEPHEASLRTVDDALVVRLETEFLEIREAIGSGAEPDLVEQRALRIGALLDKADGLLEQGGGTTAAFTASFAIVLREGLEGALLILLLLGVARRSGAAAADTRAVHYGWLGAVGLGVITWFASGLILDRLGGARRELIEGIVALLAAAVLLTVSHFVLARLDAQRRVAALKERLARAASSPRRKLVLASLAFVAVYREAFETVLFLQAILLDSGTSVAAVIGGAGLAAVILIGLVFAMTRLGRRLRPAPLLTALGLLLCVLAVALAGKGVRALQEAGTLGITPNGAPRLDWFGIYPTHETLAAQAVVLVAFVALAGWAFAKNRGAAPENTAAAGA